MRWAFPVVRIAGTEIRIHVTFLLLPGLVAGGAWHSGGAAAALEGTTLILLLFASVLLHELGHAAAARRYGIATPYIVLLPIGGIAALAAGGPRRSVTGVMRAGGPCIRPGMPLDEAVQRMGDARPPALPVADDDGRLLGMVTPASVGRLVAMEGAAARAPAAAQPGPLPLPLPTRG